MNQKKLIKTIFIMTVAGIFIGGCVGIQSALMSERDVQKLPADYQVTASELTAEFLSDADKARLKYLSDDGLCHPGKNVAFGVTGSFVNIFCLFNAHNCVLG